MMQLLTSQKEPHVLQLMLRKLAPTYGPAKSNGQTMVFAHEPPPDEVSIAREQAIKEINLHEVMEEVDYRVSMVIDLNNSWSIINLLSLSLSTKKEDKAKVKAFLSWAQEMRRVAETLINEPNYRDDSMWPPVPDIVGRLNP